MNTNILIDNTDEIQQELDLNVAATTENENEENVPQMLEVVAKDFSGKQLIID
jgi:hypothetical protein